MVTKKTLKLIALNFLLAIAITAFFVGLSYLGAKSREATRENERKYRTDTVLNEEWKFHQGDDPSWASPQFKDSLWPVISLDSVFEKWNGKISWFRMQFKPGAEFTSEISALVLRHPGASELYVDGRKLATYGIVSNDIRSEVVLDPHSFPVNVHFLPGETHCLAIRYSNNHLVSNENFGRGGVGFTIHVGLERIELIRIFSDRQSTIAMIAIGIVLLTLAFVHFLLYLFYRQAKENLFYCIFVCCYGLVFFLVGLDTASADPQFERFCNKLLPVLVNPFLFLSLLVFAHYVFDGKLNRSLWWAVLAGVFGILYSVTDWVGPGVYFISLISLAVFTVVSLLFSTYYAVKNKKPGARILGFGTSVFALFVFLSLSMMFYSSHLSFNVGSNGVLVAIILFGALLSIPLTMSIYLAYNFSITNKSLQLKLQEVENLSQKTIQQEREKQEILSRQKETLEIQVEERTFEIMKQKAVIEEKNKDITDSITYAQRIQQALFASDILLTAKLKRHFILFKPKDIVSGDFYWTTETDERFYLAVCDSTGHGVPGAFMSLLNISFLNEAIGERKMADPAEILNYVRDRLVNSISADGGKDGMDGILLCIHKQSGAVTYAAAHNAPVWIHDNTLHELDYDKMPVGLGENKEPFRSFKLDPLPGGMLYLFTDGYADQFGGDKGKKFKHRALLQKLTDISGLSMDEQRQTLHTAFESWKGSLEQIDDVLIIGLQLR